MNDLGTITLETENLILRKFKIEDAEGMYYGCTPVFLPGESQGQRSLVGHSP